VLSRWAPINLLAYPENVGLRGHLSVPFSAALLLVALAPSVPSIAQPEYRVAAAVGPGDGYIGFGLQRGPATYLMVVDQNGQTRSLAGGGITGFGWSPDGSRIVFSRVEGAGADSPANLYEVKSLRGRLPVFTDNTGTDFRDLEPAWSPDRGTIAFSRRVPNTVSTTLGAITLVDNSGKNARRLSSPPPPSGNAVTYDHQPAWSPDSKYVAFSRYENGYSNLVVINADGTNERTLTTGSSVSAPSWSPDGTRLAYVDGPSTSRELFTVGPDGTNRLQLTRDKVPKYTPAWAPDGTRIAYSAQTDANSVHLFVINVDGGQQTEVTRAVGHQVTPSWSPNSRFLAYLAFSPRALQTVQTADAIGSVQRLSLETRDVRTLASGRVNVLNVAWQPSSVEYPAADGLSRR
jgi:dipeptidyl aminopeptidase/acylaminoacyl peptidase